MTRAPDAKIIVICDCGRQLKAPPELAGRQARCPWCRKSLQIPQRAAATEKQAPVSAPVAKIVETPDETLLAPLALIESPPATSIETPAAHRATPPVVLRQASGSPPYLPQDGRLASATKECPYCCGEVAARAAKCKWCGEWIDRRARPAILPIKVVPAWNQPFFLLLTLNIYELFWLHRVFDELHRRNYTDLTPGTAVGRLFIPFYNLYWNFRVWSELGQAVERAYQEANWQRPAMGVVWLPPIVTIVAFPISFIPIVGLLFGIVSITMLSIAICTVQASMNRLAEAEAR